MVSHSSHAFFWHGMSHRWANRAQVGVSWNWGGVGHLIACRGEGMKVGAKRLHGVFFTRPKLWWNTSQQLWKSGLWVATNFRSYLGSGFLGPNFGVLTRSSGITSITSNFGDLPQSTGIASSGIIYFIIVQDNDLIFGLGIFSSGLFCYFLIIAVVGHDVNSIGSPQIWILWHHICYQKYLKDCRIIIDEKEKYLPAVEGS